MQVGSNQGAISTPLPLPEDLLLNEPITPHNSTPPSTMSEETPNERLPQFVYLFKCTTIAFQISVFTQIWWHFGRASFNFVLHLFFIQIVPNSVFQQIYGYFGKHLTKDMAQFAFHILLFHKRPGKYDVD